ncbi:hypothetical protein Peur_030681 [Populus x canadensis]
MAMEDNAAIPVSLIDIHPLSEMKMDRGSEIDTSNKNYGSKYGAWKLSALLWPLRDVQSGFIPMVNILLLELSEQNLCIRTYVYIQFQDSI